ncbi:magnesium transporter MRS2 homolog, mitochondrial [Ctenodactylus gundi]
MERLQSLSRLLPRAGMPPRTLCSSALSLSPAAPPFTSCSRATCLLGKSRSRVTGTAHPAARTRWPLGLSLGALRPYTARSSGRDPALSCPSLRAPGGRSCEWYRFRTFDVSQATLASVAPVFTVTKFDQKGNVTSFERKKTELYQELGLQARDLRFQHVMSITTRNNRIIMRMEYLKAVITPECLLVLDYRNLNLEQWLFRELPSQLAAEGQLVTYPLPFEFRAIEALLQYWINTLQGKLSVLQPLILETLEALVDPKHSSVDRSKLHILLQNGKSLSELETDIKIFKESILEILDEEELLEELCLTKWSDPHVFEKSSAGIDHAEEMELLLENYYRLADDLSNTARELRALIDDSQSVIFINLDSHRNIMMRLNLQLTMGTFSLSLFGLMGVAFGMNLESSLEEDQRVFWLITGIMFMGSGLIWRRLLSFLGRQLESPLPPLMASLPKKTSLAGRVADVKTSLGPDGLSSSRDVLSAR